MGGFTLEAAEVAAGETNSVTDGELGGEAGDRAGAVLAGLAVLVDQNLVQRGEQGDGEPRFGMLETIREYGLE